MKPSKALTSRTLSIALLLSLFAGLLAGCSGGGQATPLPPDKVTLQLQWVTQAQFAGYYVALDKGWYLEEGIDLTITPGGPDLVPVDLVAAGTRDFATSLLADLTLAIQRGTPVISIAQIQQSNGLMLVAHKSSGITGPDGFTGKHVGVWLGAWQAQFDALIAQAGLSRNDFDLVAQGYSMDPFLNGELDVASAMIYNEYQVVLESGVSADDLTIIDYAQYGLGFPGDTLFTLRSTAEQNPDLCVRMLRASLRGWQYAVENPEEAADIVLKYDTSGVQTRQHQVAMMQEIAKLVLVPGRELGFTNQADVQLMIDNLVQYGVLPQTVAIDQIFTNQFWEQVQNAGQ